MSRTLKIVAVTVMLVGSVALADPVTTTVSVGADAFVRDGWQYPDRNYSAGTTFTINAPSYERQAYLRFDVSGLIPAGRQVTSAYLRVYSAATVSSFNCGLYGLADGATGDAAPGSGGWVESGITYNNAPSATVSLGTFAVSGYGSHYFGWPTGDTALVNFLNADTNGLVTFRLTSDSSTDAVFNSREATGSGAAYLSITTEAVPEPATMSLLGAGAVLGLLRSRRSK